MPGYLQKRRRRWYGVLEIPKALRLRFGKPRFVQSLETESRSVAERRVLPIVALWKKEIARAKSEPVEDDAAFWRRRLLGAKTDEKRASILQQIEFEAWDIGAANVPNVGVSPSSDPEARKFYAEATGQLVKFAEHMDEWLGTSQSSLKTRDMQRSDVLRFAREFEMVGDIERSEVRRWVNRLMTGENLKPKTVQRILSALRGYWRYLQSINVADEDHEPFSKLNVARDSKRVSHVDSRQPFDPMDVVKLLDAAVEREDNSLADLIRLAMWTGCRIEELCALKIPDVKGDYFSVGASKTKAGVRDVPIHSQLRQTVARLIETTRDGYVLSGLTENKYGDRSNGIGKRFGRLKSGLGYGPQLVFHSIRKTFVTILENEGVPENVVADIVGHEKPTMTYGLYSGGTSLSVKKDGMEKVSYSVG